MGRPPLRDVGRITTIPGRTLPDHRGVRIEALLFSPAVQRCCSDQRFSSAVQICGSAQALAHDLAELAGFEHVGVVAQLAL
jgi:hypothetical protein